MTHVVKLCFGYHDSEFKIQLLRKLVDWPLVWIAVQRFPESVLLIKPRFQKILAKFSRLRKLLIHRGSRNFTGSIVAELAFQRERSSPE